jgi:ABC-type phosphate transport system permease subunit
MAIPSGKHVIEFKFEPDSYTKAKNITWASNFILLILVISLSWLGIKSKKNIKHE